MIEESVEVFMDDFFVFGNSFETCLNNIDKMLQRCKDAHLVLNWEKCHFIVKEGIVLGHKVSSAGLEVDKAKIDVISKLSPLANIKGSRKLAFVFIVVDTCKETRVRRKDIISNSDTDKIIARMDAMTLKMDAQYKELQSNAKKAKLDLDEDDIPMSRKEEAKFMQTFQTFMDLKTQHETVATNHQASIQNLETKFDKLSDKQSGRPSGSLPSNTQPNPKGHNSKTYQPPQARNEHVNAVFTRSVPKPKASTRRKRSGSDTSITPPTATTTPKLTADAKGKQRAKSKSLSDPSEVARTEAQQLKIIIRRSRQQTHISQPGGSGTDEGTGSKPGVLDVPIDESKEELLWNSFDDEGADDQVNDGDDDEGDEGDKSDEGEEDADEEKDESESDEEDDNEETREEDNFDPIPRTPKSSEDEGDGEEDQGLNVNEEEHVEEEEEDELYRDVNINQGKGLQATLEVEDTHTDRLRDSYQRENDEFLRTIDENMKRIIKEQVKGQVKEQVSRILPRIKQSMNAQLEAEVLTRSSHSSRTSYAVAKVLTRSSHSSRTSYAIAADLSKMELKKILIKKMEGNKSIQRSNEQRNLYKALVEAYDADKEGSMHQLALHLKQLPGVQADLPQGLNLENYLPPKRPPSPDHDWNTTLPAAQRDAQSWISILARQTDARSSFNELLDTSIDFSNFIMNRLNIDTLTPALLASPTYKLMRGSCTSLTELEYHLEEVYKATTDQLDWVNPEGDSSRKYTTSVTKTKATDYGHIKWIEDLVPRTMWIQEPINYDKHALWGVSHWGRKRQQFYGFAVNQESALDVYSKKKIIAVIELKIMEWHNYKHLDWISVRRDDDKIYKFKRDDFKRLRLQDIEDTLLLLVQGKLSNLTVEEHFAFNISLRMFTRRIVIQRRVEDLQLGVERYQKRLNLTKPDTYRPDLKRREAYTAYRTQEDLSTKTRTRKTD
uniref:Retrovirus-related Pol polyprotein from transposon 17.6 n=1 Tax=Tanacetum cinerariifolium TaxID=118510 RepID=A0A6L2KE17_TANCI|nr:retrovirus-related Pol polyprotein from transposon 17.6 [Tanacetum cinerariifolium]